MIGSVLVTGKVHFFKDCSGELLNIRAAMMDPQLL